MNPNIWGPHAWVFLHSITMSYPDNPSSEEKQAAKNFVSSLEYLLPCTQCKENFTSHVKKVSEKTFDSKKNFFEWFVDVHNNINKHHGKKTYTYKEVIEHYKKKYGINENYSSYTNIFLLMITTSIILYLIMQHFRKT